MLVLSRKPGESIKVGDIVTITVLETRGDKIRLGIEAPPEVPVHRQEVWEAIQRQKADKPPIPPSQTTENPPTGEPE
jgi:carbon storage regulator